MKRFLSLFLSFAVAVGSYSAAFAEETDTTGASASDASYISVNADRPIDVSGFVVMDRVISSVSDEDEGALEEENLGENNEEALLDSDDDEEAFVNNESNAYADDEEYIKEVSLDALDDGTFTVAIDENGVISEAKDNDSSFNVTFNYKFSATTSSEYNEKLIPDNLLDQAASGDIRLCQITTVSKGVSARVKIPGRFKVNIEGAETDVVVVSVRSSAFEGSLLQSIELSDTITQIGASAFKNCSQLETVVLNFNTPSTADAGKSISPTLGDSAFEGSAVKDVKIYTSEGNTSASSSRAVTFGDYTFRNCAQLSDFIIEKAADASLAAKVKFGAYTFENCESLVTFTFPENVYSLGNYTFENCANLETFQISSDFTTAITAAKQFNRCQSLRQFLPPANDKTNSKYIIIDDCLVYNSTATTTLILYPPSRPGTSYTVPEEINKVADYGFGSNSIDGSYAQANKNLKNLYFENESFGDIGVGLFVNNKTIETVGFAGKVGSIGASCFENATALKSFDYTNALNSVNVSAKTPKIDTNAFYGCSSLAKMDLKYWGTIGTSAFQGCTGLSELNLGYIITINASAFKDCTSLDSLSVDYSVGTVGNEVFKGCSALTYADISLLGRNDPEGVGLLTSKSTFGTGVFEDCINLKTCIIPDALTGLSSRTFYNCVSLQTVAGSDTLLFGGTITYNKETGFREAQGYTGGSFISVFASECFYNCGNLQEVIVPRFLTGIGSHAFYGCNSLTELSFTRSVLEELTSADAFEGCSASLVIKAPEGSGMYDYAINNGISRETVEDDMEDEEFAIYDDENGDGSYNVTTGYRGGFKELVIKVPANDYDYRIDGISESSTGSVTKSTGWIDCPENSSGNMKKYLKKLTLQNISIGVGDSSNTTLYTNGKNQFKNATALEEVIWLANPNEAVSKDLEICDSAFYGCTSLKSVVFSDDIIIIDKNAFYNCKLLETLKLPKRLARIGETAFSGCTKLMKLQFYAALQEIGKQAFLNCSDLTTVTLPGGAAVGTNAFKGCTGITRVIAPSTVKIASTDDPFADGIEGGITIVTDSASTIVSYAANKGFKVEYASFVNGVNASEIKIKGQVIDTQGRVESVTKNGSAFVNIKHSEPEEATGSYEETEFIYKDYTLGDAEDYVTEGDVLQIALTSKYKNLPFITINDKKLAEVVNGIATYQVGENEHISIKTADENQQYIRIAQNITVKRGKEILEDYSIINPGDVLTITSSPENGYGVSSLKVNGADFTDGGTYTVNEGENVYITAEFEKLAYHITIPDRVLVFKNGESILSGAEVKAGDELTITAFPPSEEYVVRLLTINGTEFENGGTYTVLPYTNVVIIVRFYAENETGGYLYGDATGNGKIETTDAAAILNRVLKGDKSLTAVEKNSTLTAEQAKAILDVDGDGEITASDAAHVRKSSLDSSYVLPVER